MPGTKRVLPGLLGASKKNQGSITSANTAQATFEKAWQLLRIILARERPLRFNTTNKNKGNHHDNLSSSLPPNAEFRCSLATQDSSAGAILCDCRRTFLACRPVNRRLHVGRSYNLRYGNFAQRDCPPPAPLARERSDRSLAPSAQQPRPPRRKLASVTNRSDHTSVGELSGGGRIVGTRAPRNPVPKVLCLRQARSERFCSTLKPQPPMIESPVWVKTIAPAIAE